MTLISNLMAPILQLFDFDYSDSWLNCNPRTWDYFKYTVQGQSVMDKQTACESSITVILLLLKSRLPHVYLFIFSYKHFKCKKETYLEIISRLSRIHSLKFVFDEIPKNPKIKKNPKYEFLKFAKNMKGGKNEVRWVTDQIISTSSRAYPSKNVQITSKSLIDSQYICFIEPRIYFKKSSTGIFEPKRSL